MKFLIVIYLFCLIIQKFINGLPTGHHLKNQLNESKNYLWNNKNTTSNHQSEKQSTIIINDQQNHQQMTNDELEEILLHMKLPSNVTTFDYGDNNDNDLLMYNNYAKNYSQHGFVIIWRNPYHNDNNVKQESRMLARDSNGDNDDDDDDEEAPVHNNKQHEFDEMEQRDFLRTVIFLANQQIRMKFHLCEIRRFRYHYVRRWNLYRCSARFTVARLGKKCDPNQTYDGYVNFIVQNPELPPLLAIRYYVFQFLYESSMGFVNKMNDHASPSLISSSSSNLPSLQSIQQMPNHLQTTDDEKLMMLSPNDLMNPL